MQGYLITKIFLILIFISQISAQENDSSLYKDNYSVVIDTIQIRGNSTTKDFIILRELTFAEGDTITPDILDYNRERIFSLALFTRVDLQPYKKNDVVYLQISVEESWYIYPIPFAQLEEKDWNKISYGLILVLKNFRGMNETLIGRVSLGYDPSLLLSYFNPYLDRKNDIFFGIDLLYRTSQNKSKIAELLAGDVFDQKIISAAIILGKRFGLFHRVRGDFGFTYIETPFYIRGISASDDRIDRVFSGGLTYSYDTRDLAQFPKSGIFGVAQFQHKGFGFDNISYNIFRIDFREYRNIIGDLYAKWRFTSRIANGGLVPYYDYSFLGLGDRIRGYYNRQQEGNRSFLTSVEMYHPIIKEMNISFDFIPLLPKELFTYRLALYAQMFADSGTTKLKGKPLSIRDFNTGFGLGLTLLVLPYDQIRVEYAFDEFLNAELIIDVGISF